MSRFEARPDAALVPFVESYWGFAREFARDREFAITPDCFAELIFFDQPPRVRAANGELRSLPHCVFVPLLNEPVTLLLRGELRCAAARLHAWAAPFVVDAIACGSRSWCDVTEEFGATVPAVRNVLRAQAWPDVKAALDRTLARRLDTSHANLRCDIVETFCRTDGSPPPGTPDVAARYGRSRRAIERKVREQTGRSPKELARLARFQIVRDALWMRPGIALAGLALDAGYADQAHLSREFRRYTGLSPSEFRREVAERASILRTEPVAVLQDDASASCYAPGT